MSLNGSGEFNRYLLNNGPNLPSVPQNTPACSSFSDRMMVQMNLKNLRHPEGVSLTEKDAVLRNLSNRLMSLNSNGPSNPTYEERVISREEALLELQRTRLGYLITHLERINLIEGEREAEVKAINSLQEKLTSGGHVDLGAMGPRVEEGALNDFWPIVLENVALPCVGETELRLFEFVTNITAEFIPADIEGLKKILAKTCDDSGKSSEWPTCDTVPGTYGNGVKITLYFRHNNIIMCPGNKLTIEIHYDIEVPHVVTSVVCSSFNRIDESTLSAPAANNEDDTPDLNLLELVEAFSKGLDLSTLGEEEGSADFYQEAADQLSSFCDAIKSRIIPYASQIYFKAIHDDGKEEEGEHDD